MLDMKSGLILSPILILLPVLQLLRSFALPSLTPDTASIQNVEYWISLNPEGGSDLGAQVNAMGFANTWVQRAFIKANNIPTVQNTTPTSPGWDFWIFWRIGRATDPYSVHGAIYPPPMTLLFRIIGLLPEAYAFYLWTAFNLILLVIMFKRRALLYTLFMPTMFHIATGQVDIIFMWFSTFLKRNDWFAAIAGALISFKPQIAIILLPWHLLRWSRKTQLGWAALMIGLWGYYLVFHPEMYTQWLGKATGTYNVEVTATPSLFSVFPFGVAVLVSASVLIVTWRYLSEKAAIAAGVLTMPFGKTYDAVLLLRSDIPWWIVLLSWIFLGLSHLLGSPWPQMLIPATVFVMIIVKHRDLVKSHWRGKTQNQN